MRIGTVLRKWRIGSERSLREVAAEIGIHHSTLARLEKGISPPVEALIKIGMWLITSEESVNGANPNSGTVASSGNERADEEVPTAIELPKWEV